MLKFRVTNSMRARRAADAQRKALEDKLQLEWAWKPMAAMMNEKQTDLVYWIPPLYRNNIKQAGSRVRRKSLAKRASLAKRGTMAASTRVPYHHLQAAQRQSQFQTSQKKKKLARRRHKLATEVSFEVPTDTDSIVVQTSSSKSGWEDTKDEDNESGIHDETTDYNADDMSLHPTSIQEEDFVPVPGAMKRRLAEYRRVRRSTIKPKVPPKPDYITRSFEAIDKPKPAPTLIRLLEKVSHIHSRPVKPVKPVKPELKKINRRGSVPKVSSKQKVRRPSVKIYRNPPQRLSGKRSKGIDEEEDIANQCVIVSIDHTQQEPPKPLKVPPMPQPQPEPSKDTTKEGPSKPDDAEFRNAQLQMILRLLAQLYEEKVSRQDSEIQNLKTRIQTQDKLMKQMAHVVLELKEEVSKIRLHSSVAPEEPISKMPTHVLNIKLKEEVSKILQSTTPVPQVSKTLQSTTPVPPEPAVPTNVLSIKVGEH